MLASVYPPGFGPDTKHVEKWEKFKVIYNISDSQTVYLSLRNLFHIHLSEERLLFSRTDKETRSLTAEEEDPPGFRGSEDGGW